MSESRNFPPSSSLMSLSSSSSFKSASSFKQQRSKKELSESEKLAIENEKMSDRLKSLKERMEMEKKRIEGKRQSNNGSIWLAGKEGFLHGHAEKVLNKHRESLASLRLGRFKGITEQVNQKMAKESPASSAVFPMTSLVTKTSSLVKPVAIVPKKVTIIDATQNEAESLLEGKPFDESESAESFQAALKAWRSSRSTVQSSSQDPGDIQVYKQEELLNSVVNFPMKKTFILSDTHLTDRGLSEAKKMESNTINTQHSPKLQSRPSASTSTGSESQSLRYLNQVQDLFTTPSSTALSYAEKLELAKLKPNNGKILFLTNFN